MLDMFFCCFFYKKWDLLYDNSCYDNYHTATSEMFIFIPLNENKSRIFSNRVEKYRIPKESPTRQN
jgi:hypothetical protein